MLILPLMLGHCLVSSGSKAICGGFSHLKGSTCEDFRILNRIVWQLWITSELSDNSDKPANFWTISYCG